MLVLFSLNFIVSRKTGNSNNKNYAGEVACRMSHVCTVEEPLKKEQSFLQYFLYEKAYRPKYIHSREKVDGFFSFFFIVFPTFTSTFLPFSPCLVPNPAIPFTPLRPNPNTDTRRERGG